MVWSQPEDKIQFLLYVHNAEKENKMIFTVFIFAYKILTLFSTALVVFNVCTVWIYTICFSLKIQKCKSNEFLNSCKILLNGMEE